MAITPRWQLHAINLAATMELYLWIDNDETVLVDLSWTNNHHSIMALADGTSTRHISRVTKVTIFNVQICLKSCFRTIFMFNSRKILTVAIIHTLTNYFSPKWDWTTSFFTIRVQTPKWELTALFALKLYPEECW